MRIRRSTSERAFIAANITDDHILAAITDPERVEQDVNGNVYRIVGLARPLPGAQMVMTADERYDNPSLIRVIYEARPGEAFVIHADEADEEDLDEWIGS